MRPLIECIPNFSEGRDSARIRALVAAMSGIPGAWVLDTHSDPDHNRTVITVAGEPEAVYEAALRGVGKAAELLDLNVHSGAHPRIGSADVLPFVPVEGVSMQDCVNLAHRAGAEIWKRFAIPVYFYQAAALRPERRALELVRKGQFEALRQNIGSSPDRSPDIGDARLHPTAGAVAVGARDFLVAYNVNLNTPDASVARRIARAIRESNGGLPAVKAMGVNLAARRLAQVSMNLVDFRRTTISDAFNAVLREAERRGCNIAGSEIVGLVPRQALGSSDVGALRFEQWSPSMILENRLASVLNA